MNLKKRSDSKCVWTGRFFGFGVFLVVLIGAGEAWPYTIQTGLTKACHEKITLEAISHLIAENNWHWAKDLEFPDNSRWKDVLAYLAVDMDIDAINDERNKYILLSLLIGARYPDNRGKSVSNFQSLREIHRDPYGQDAHSIRAAQHDAEAGNITALDNAKAFVQANVDEVYRYLRKSPYEQNILVSIYIEFYGLVNVDVWGPAFYAGNACHGVQDSFSHTIRSDDLLKVYHVANYVDGIAMDYDEARDGIRHSWAMDRCEDEAKDIAVGAFGATIDFLTPFQTENASIWTASFFEKWMAYEPGCTLANNYCRSKWEPIARTDPSLPLASQVFGCSSAPGVPLFGDSLIRRLLKLF